MQSENYYGVKSDINDPWIALGLSLWKKLGHKIKNLFILMLS